MSYTSLNDAAALTGDARLARGPTRIWYTRPEHQRDYSGGYQWLKRAGIPVPDAKTIGQTHVKLGSIDSTNLHEIFQIMQGEHWSPGAEARELIVDTGLGHTSMMIGDIIQLPDGSLHMVDRGYSFERIGNPHQSRVRVEDLPAFLDAAEHELVTARQHVAADPDRAVGSAVSAAYYAGAASYLAREQGAGEELSRAERTFMDAYELAHRACGPRSNPTKSEVQESYRRGAAALSAKEAAAQAQRSLERARAAGTPREAIQYGMAAAVMAGMAWAHGSRKAQRLVTEAEAVVARAVQRIERTVNPAQMRRNLLR